MIALLLAGTMAGLVAGSFIGAVVCRWPEAALAGRSRCDRCGSAIPMHSLVPVLSFAVQRGQARCCGMAIDPTHLIAELLATGIGLLSVTLLGSRGWAAALLGWQLLALALIDLRALKLPNAQTVLLALTGVTAAAIIAPADISDRFVGAAGGFLALELIRRGCRLVRGREGIGGGDPKLFGALGAWLGWQALPMLLLVGSLVGVAAGLVMLARNTTDRPPLKLPFGSLLALAAWTIFLWQSVG